MPLATPLLARLRMESSAIAERVARVPLLGAVLRKIGDRLIPRGTLLWTRIQAGPARGLWLLLDARTAAEQRRGVREPDVQQAIRTSLSAGQVFYDVGANVGFFTLLAARQVGPSGAVVAFEPDPDVADRLRRAAEHNEIPNVTVIEAAIWSRKGVVPFERGLTSPDRGVGRVVAASEGANRVSVRAITLDEYVAAAAPPHLVKCDVEGAEVEVFRGALGLLARHRPSVICEVHSAANLQALQELFRQCGYHVRQLEPEGAFPVHIAAEPAS